MSQELALSHYARQWLGQVATSAKLTPTHSCQRWLLHLTPDSPYFRTVTLQVRWSGSQCGFDPIDPDTFSRLGL